MTVFQAYGTNAHTAHELSGILSDHLGVDFTERERSYLGCYFLATLADTTRIQIQPNAIPGDDGEDDLYEDEHPDVAVLILVTAPNAVQPYESQLSAVEGLALLRSSRR
jgi:hypothetical protein